jgi:hypothetical protein
MIKRIHRLMAKILRLEISWRDFGVWTPEDDAWAEALLDKLSDAEMEAMK